MTAEIKIVKVPNDILISSPFGLRINLFNKGVIKGLDLYVDKDDDQFIVLNRLINELQYFKHYLLRELYNEEDCRTIKTKDVFDILKSATEFHTGGIDKELFIRMIDNCSFPRRNVK